MIETQKYTTEKIISIIEVLKIKFPELEITTYLADPRFIKVSQCLGKQRVDTISVSITHTELIHIFEAEQIAKS